MEVITFIKVIFVFVGCLAMEGSSMPQPTSPSKCYEPTEQFTRIDSKNVDSLIEELQGESCYKTLDREYIREIMKKSNYDNETIWINLVANISENFCPSWSDSKECLLNHLQSQCSGDEIKNMEDAFSFNVEYTISELACEPRENKNIIYLLENAASGGLWDCFNEQECIQVFNNCMSKEDKDAFANSSFSKTRDIFNKCGPKFVKACAQKDGNDKELQLKLDFEATFGAVQDAHESLWKGLDSKPEIISDISALILFLSDLHF